MALPSPFEGPATTSDNGADVDGRRITVTEQAEVPWPSLVLGFGPVGAMAAGAALAWLTRDPLRLVVIRLTIIWAAAILAFLAGVRRGLSFRTEGGPAPAQMVTMLVYFTLSLSTLIALAFDLLRLSIWPLLIGYAIAVVADPLAGRRGQAPLFFVRLRPTQMMVAVLSLSAVLMILLTSSIEGLR